MATTRVLNRNVPYLKQQFSALLKNTSPVITFICLVTTLGYFLSFSNLAIKVLSVTPGYILPPSFWIWTAFTFCFIELHFWEVLVDIVTVGLCGKLLEPLWGQFEMFIFFAITNFGVALITTFYYLFVYMCTRNFDILVNIHIHGLAGYVAGVSVAVRQMMPDHLIANTKLGKFTNRNVPLTVLFASIIFWACNLLDGTYPVMFCSGLIVSWVYLRFYQRHPNGRGDSSESFTFASFFPNVMQPVISILVSPIYLCCLKIGVVNPPALPRSSSTSSLTSILSIPGVDPHDIERRKQIALKALSERLKTTDTNRQNSLPKSFPQAGNIGNKHHHHSSHHHHQQHHGPHSHNHQHSHQHHSHGHQAHIQQPHPHGSQINTMANITGMFPPPIALPYSSLADQQNQNVINPSTTNDPSTTTVIKIDDTKNPN